MNDRSIDRKLVDRSNRQSADIDGSVD